MKFEFATLSNEELRQVIQRSAKTLNERVKNGKKVDEIYKQNKKGQKPLSFHLIS